MYECEVMAALTILHYAIQVLMHCKKIKTAQFVGDQSVPYEICLPTDRNW